MALKMKGEAKAQEVKTGVDYGSHLTTAPITGSGTFSKSSKGEQFAQSTEESKTIHKGVFTDGSSLTVEGGRVLNLGNYETARIGVSLTIPCTKDTLDECYTFATEWVSDKIEEAVKMAKE